ncbi:HNH endonuclease signature motif containing protein [Iamia sp.]|uniref:HNH endonuclease signature motif containing protein n=1 Tax=Iamia sp. TaxID=2722710 RepID=UPI002BC69353|nr:DUF222 domain-containing protein [Iamia sp.]HXH56757.1 DUF222 domain-containing protein [Iamia sp.]
MVDVAEAAPSATTEPGDLAAFVETDLDSCTDAELIDRLLDAQRMRARLDACVVALTDRFDARTVWAADGAHNAPGWVAARVGVSYGQAKTDLALARDLRSHPQITAAHRAGRLTQAQVRALLTARSGGLEDAFDLCEEVLVSEVATATLAAGRRFLARWTQEVRERFAIAEPDGPEPDGGGVRSRAWLSPVGDRWAGQLDLCAENGEKVANAIDAQINALWTTGVFRTDDGLDPSERRAIALVEVIERGTRGGDDDGTARPLILALTTTATLTQPPPGATDGTGSERGCEPRPRDHRSDHIADPSGPPPPWPLPGTAGASDLDDPERGLAADGQLADDPLGDDLLAGLDPLAPYPAMLSELSRSGPVHPDVVRRLACEGTVIPVYVGPGADQLNMGRAIRIANRAQRRALRIRDGGCQFPGCSVPPEHCIAHHLVWWEHGGRTDLINLALLCRHHHKLVHGGGFTMTRGPDGTLVTTRTDREPLTAPLRARSPLIRTRPPPGAPPRGAPPEDDAGEIAAERRQADYLTRCRIKDLIRQAEVARHCRRRDPSDTTPLRS